MAKQIWKPKRNVWFKHNDDSKLTLQKYLHPKKWAKQVEKQTEGWSELHNKSKQLQGGNK